MLADSLKEGTFDAEVFEITAQIPAGKVATYGAVARLMGMPGYARRVGRAMGAAPAGIPCHRIVDASGRTAPGWTQQRTLLESEGVPFLRSGRVDMRQALWEELR